jgi:hypothetical protein
MSQILIETAPDQLQTLDTLALESSLNHLAQIINQIGQNSTGNLELDEVSISIKVSAQGEVILVNTSSQLTGHAMTLKFKRQQPVVNSQVNPQVTNIYQNLEHLLSTGQWQAANQETWNILCGALHKNLGTLLTAADMEQIPCASLQNLDKLWHKYSDGKFGFSAQSRIHKQTSS